MVATNGCDYKKDSDALARVAVFLGSMSIVGVEQKKKT